ncbi:MAG: acyl carrier protein [Bacteroidota bacterium]|nr:acyl carrier protein [Bacteroidota bacterium]
MTNEEIINKINHFFVEEFEAEESSLIPTEDMRKTLDLDSLDFVDLVVVVESNFGFKVNTEDFQNIISFQDFYNYVIENYTQQEAVKPS